MFEKNKTCYGCRYILTKNFADGSIIYGCKLTPGLVTGIWDLFDEDEPKACEKYEAKLNFVTKDKNNIKLI